MEVYGELGLRRIGEVTDTLEKFPLLLCPKVSHDLACDRNREIAVEGMHLFRTTGVGKYETGRSFQFLYSPPRLHDVTTQKIKKKTSPQ
jgi:hypothetical protein